MCTQSAPSAIAGLMAYLDASPTAYHATANARARLEQAGFTALDEGAAWSPQAGCGYFVERNQSALIAFRVGTGSLAADGFRLVAAHTDSPAPKLKWRGAAERSGVLRIPVESYGGMLQSTWFDRPLAIAGRIALKAADGGIRWQLVLSSRPLAIIPSLAIHLNRDVNQGAAINVQQHLAALGGACSFADILKELCGATPAELLDADLFLADCQPATLCGVNQDIISASRLDNLCSCQAALDALIAAPSAAATPVIFLADNEEVGSETAQGAASAFWRDTLERLCLTQSNGDRETIFRALSRSFLLSLDAAHAVHPNYEEKHDPAYAPVLNRGVVIKNNASFRYSSTAVSSALFRQLCRDQGIAHQDFINRSDQPCGSTVGPTCAARLGVKAVDVGIPLWAMHSSRESAGVKDQQALTEAVAAIFAMP
ncbi:MAG: M18 family aminopeptidase [Lentisphaeria bacterium]|nr:M18 family aminopeptidase [Lentisphaeria bacterium]